MRVTVAPDKADAVLVVDPNTVLPASIASQTLKSMHDQIAKFASGGQIGQLALGDSGHLLKSSAESPGKECLSFRIGKRSNHLIRKYHVSRYTSSRTCG